MRIKRPHQEYTSHWHHDRFLAAVRGAGIEPDDRGAGTRLAEMINTRRDDLGIPSKVAANTCRRWLKGEQDPTAGAVGARPACFELALALGVSIEWLLAGEQPA